MKCKFRDGATAYVVADLTKLHGITLQIASEIREHVDVRARLTPSQAKALSRRLARLAAQRQRSRTSSVGSCGAG